MWGPTSAPIESGLLSQFPVQGGEMILARVESAAGQRPHVAGRKLEADEQDFAGRRQEQGPHRLPDPQAGGAQSAQSLGVSLKPSLKSL